MRLDYKDCGKIGITCSTFDLLHAGHVVMLEEAKRHCDYLIAALQVDPTQDRQTKNKPIQSIVERQIQLAAVKYVDEIVMYSTESELEDLFLTLPLNVRILGTEYRDKEFTAKQICLCQITRPLPKNQLLSEAYSKMTIIKSQEELFNHHYLKSSNKSLH